MSADDAAMEKDAMTESEKPKPPRRALGRGLSALLGEAVQEEVPVAADGTPAATGSAAGSIQTIDISRIKPHPGQPRRHFDDAALQELADSIALRGVVQPILVRPLGNGYQIVAGERRWRAAQRAQLHRIPAIVRDLTDAETLEIALVENIQRQDLNPIEEAEAYKKLIAEFGHSQEELGKLVGKSRSHVANLMRLLELPRPVQQAVIEHRISMGHARALIGSKDAESIAQMIEDKGLSVRETEKLASDSKGKASNPRSSVSGGGGKPVRDADIVALEHHLADILGVKVEIVHRPDGRGQLSLNYSTLDQLDMLCQRLSGEAI